MRTKQLFEKLKGRHTVESVMKLLDCNRQRAIHCIYRLRRAGYVKTKRDSDGTRHYYISFDNKLGTSIYDVICKDSPMGLVVREDSIVYGKSPSAEDALIFAIRTKSIRVMISALSLFKRINDWPRLYQLAKKYNLQREIGALYDLASKFIRTKKMPSHVRKVCLPAKTSKYRYILDGFESKHFKDIEKVWKIYLPFNKGDLEDYL